MAVLVPVILSGGSGTRLWPLSREHFPKQCLSLAGQHSLLQQTAHRARRLTAAAVPLVIGNHQHRFLIAEQLREAEVEARVVLEPLARNTAPAVAAAALLLAREDAGALMLILPADHVIGDTDAFVDAVRRGRAAAEQDRLVIFGIRPTRPETGYGYIRAGDGAGEQQAVPVAAFVEKPQPAAAQAYCADGGYLWNSGIVLCRASTVLAEMERWCPALLAAVTEAVDAAREDLDFLRLDEARFADVPSLSFDYAVLEKTDRAAVVPLTADWDDVGSWSALHAATAADAQGNVQQGDVYLEDVADSYVRAEHRLVAAVGIREHIIVETADAVLVAHRDRAQEVKRIVSRLQADDREERLTHRRVYRPWGWYEGIALGGRFQVKHIYVKPGAALSLQSHHHRAEHWIVVSGTARVVRGEEDFLLGEDESTYISVGQRHRLENPGKIALHLIEVQTGGYLGEDDIVRYDDRYGR